MLLAEGSRTVPCVCCLMPAMRVKLDKRGRPFLGCAACGTMLFPRGGALGTLAAATTAQLLEVEENAAWVRQQAYGEVAKHGEGALHSWLRVASQAVATSSPADVSRSPVREVVNG